VVSSNIVPAGRRVEVEVPATSANLGPGFDCLGLALDWRDRVVFETLATGSDPQVRVEISGEGAERLPADADNLIVRSLLTGLQRSGHTVGGLRVTVRNSIPQGRGLGSSSAAIVAGLAAAHALTRPGKAFDPGEWLPVADAIEGHPDNVAAALYGGLVMAYRPVAEPDGAKAAVALVHPEVTALLLIPRTAVATHTARAVLPDQVPHAEAAANAGRAALLVHALTTDPRLLYEATAEWLHQDYRSVAMPQSAELVRRLRDHGLPAVISGAGPTVLVLGTESQIRAARAVAPARFRAVAVAPGPGVSLLEACDPMEAAQGAGPY
jgi:homoserine kinase